MNAGALVNLVVYLIIIAVLVALVQYVVKAIPIPEPLGRIIIIASVVIGVLVILLALLGILGVSGGVPVIVGGS